MKRTARRVFLVLVGVLQGCALPYAMTGPAVLSPGDPREPTEEEAPAPIRWYGPSDATERARLDRWASYVGPPVVVPTPAPRRGAGVPADSLTIITWNMDVGAGDLQALLRDELGYSCGSSGDAPARSTAGHFIILLQEADRVLRRPVALDDPHFAARRRSHPPRPDGDADVPEVARRCGLALFYVPAGRNGMDRPGAPARDKGNAILSTLPLSDLVAIELPFDAERRVSLAATVEMAGAVRLRVVDAHLETLAGLYRTLLTGDDTRLRQTRGLLEVLTDLEAPDHDTGPVVLGGDFNTRSGGVATLRALRIAFPESPKWDGLSTVGPFPADHVFFRTGSRGRVELTGGSYRRIGHAYGSDHVGRVVDLSVPAASPVRPPPRPAARASSARPTRGTPGRPRCDRCPPRSGPRRHAYRRRNVPSASWACRSPP